jgi:hypothetical protein
MQNRIIYIKPSFFKRIMIFLFYKQFCYLLIMHKFNCSRKQAKALYEVWKEFKK